MTKSSDLLFSLKKDDKTLSDLEIYFVESFEGLEGLSMIIEVIEDFEVMEKKFKRESKI